jgi:hypothetical protein
MEGRLTIRTVALVGLVQVALVVFVLQLSGSPLAQTPSPSEQDCRSASEIQQFTETGETTTEYFDVPTGQAYVSWEFPGAPSGIIYRLDVSFEREPPPGEPGEADPVAPIGSLGIIEDPPDTEPNQGQTKLEDVPGRYRMEFSPSDPDQEYVVTVYECDPSGGESTIPSSSPSPGGSTTVSPNISPAPKTSSPAPKTPSPAPETPSPAPESPAPAPDPPPDSGTLMNAGGPTTGPVPMMPNGSCPRELPVKRDGACYST